MSTIKIKCIEQTLQIINTPKIASGGKEINTMQFEFCPTWEGFGKTAVFYRENKVNGNIVPPDEVYNVVLVNDACIIPNEVLQEHGRFCFGVFGIKDNLTLPSEILRYEVVKGSFILGKEPSEPTPGIYEQILTNYGLMDERYKEVNDQYRNIFNNLEETVANMPAKGFVNLNTGKGVISFWVGTKAEYDALSEIVDGVHYVVTDFKRDLDLISSNVTGVANYAVINKTGLYACVVRDNASGSYYSLTISIDDLSKRIAAQTLYRSDETSYTNVGVYTSTSVVVDKTTLQSYAASSLVSVKLITEY